MSFRFGWRGINKHLHKQKLNTNGKKIINGINYCKHINNKLSRYLKSNLLWSTCFSLFFTSPLSLITLVFVACFQSKQHSEARTCVFQEVWRCPILLSDSTLFSACRPIIQRKPGRKGCDFIRIFRVLGRETISLFILNKVFPPAK